MLDDDICAGAGASQRKEPPDPFGGPADQDGFSV